MKGTMLVYLLLLALLLTANTVHAEDMKVVSDTSVGGFLFPESAGCEPAGKAVYVSQFVSALKPVDKDGKGRISKVGLDGKTIEPNFLPGPGDVLHKPKGVWVEGERLWVSDIDVVWVFDLNTRKGRQVTLPGAQFANDVAVKGDTLYVTDNRLDAVFMIQPADFLDTPETPAVTQITRSASTNPNGIYPARDGSLILAGMGDAAEPRGLYALHADGKVATLADDQGKLDGLYQSADGSLLVTDWASGTLFSWNPAKGRQTLASDFKGPADFCAITSSDGLDLIVPDLIKGELRLIRLH